MTEHVSGREGSPLPESFMVTPIVFMVFERGNQVLLIQRNSGRFSLPAGHVEDGERVEDTAARESSEELGVEVATADFNLMHVSHLKDRVGQRVCFFMKATSWKGEPENLEPDRCLGMGWYDKDQLPESIIPDVKAIIGDMRQGIFFSQHGWEE